MAISLNTNSFSAAFRLDGMRSIQLSGNVRSINDLGIALSNEHFSNILKNNNNSIDIEMRETMGHEKLIQAFRYSGFFDEAAINDFFNFNSASWSFIQLLDEKYIISVLLNKAHPLGSVMLDGYLSLIKSKPPMLVFSAHFPYFRETDTKTPLPSIEEFKDGMPLILEDAAFHTHY